MKSHVEDVISLRSVIDDEMPLHLFDTALHSKVLPGRDGQQNVLNVGYVLHLDLHRKCFPIQDVAERWDVGIGNQDRNTISINCLHHSGTCHFVAAGAEAELALPQHCIVGHSWGELFENLDIVVFVLPLVEKQVPNVAVETPRKECQNSSLGRRRSTQASHDPSQQVDFWV